MLGALTVLLLFELGGEVLAQLFGVPVPGPVIGMALLLAALTLRGAVPENLTRTAGGILSHLSILFVPGGVGVMLYLPRLLAEWLPIAVSVVASTLITLLGTALLLRALNRRLGAKGEQR